MSYLLSFIDQKNISDEEGFEHSIGSKQLASNLEAGRICQFRFRRQKELFDRPRQRVHNPRYLNLQLEEVSANKSLQEFFAKTGSHHLFLFNN
jgi:hypothetical protein